MLSSYNVLQCGHRLMSGEAVHRVILKLIQVSFVRHMQIKDGWIWRRPNPNTIAHEICIWGAWCFTWEYANQTITQHNHSSCFWHLQRYANFVHRPSYLSVPMEHEELAMTSPQNILQRSLNSPTYQLKGLAHDLDSPAPMQLGSVHNSTISQMSESGLHKLFTIPYWSQYYQKG